MVKNQAFIFYIRIQIEAVQMPTILFINGYRFYFYAGDENEPPHVHVEKGDGSAKIWLAPELSPKYFHSFKDQEIKEIIRIAADNYDFLKAKWNEYFQK